MRHIADWADWLVLARARLVIGFAYMAALLAKHEAAISRCNSNLDSTNVTIKVDRRVVHAMAVPLPLMIMLP